MLQLLSSYFEQNPQDAINTLTHEMGHVIGLDHNPNDESLMAAVALNTEQDITPSDAAVCKYLEARWQGTPREQAANQYKVLFNR